jgi:Cu(I)/Ag(I) efflux system membrane fusion protein
MKGENIERASEWKDGIAYTECNKLMEGWKDGRMEGWKKVITHHSSLITHHAICFLFLTLLIVSTGLFVGCKKITKDVEQKGEVSDASKEESSKKEKNSEKEEYEYYCDMGHPIYVQDKPGNCPIDGMPLLKRKKGGKPVEAEKEGGEEFVSISPEIVQMLGVTSEMVMSREITKEIRTVGRIDFNEKSVKIVSSRVPGRIEKLFVDFTGANVKKGEPLVSLYSPELFSSQQEYLLALETLEKVKGSSIPETIENARSLIEAGKRRLRLWGITDEQIEKLEKNREPSTNITIYAPIEGTVIQKDALEGMYVGEGTLLYRIVDLSVVWMYADIYESEIAHVQEGQNVDITLTAYPGKNFSGKVAFIAPFLDPNTRTVQVRSEIDNQDSMLKPGMYANASLKINLSDALAVPRDAIIYSGKRAIVFIDKGNGRFAPREVVLGTEAESYYQVLSGLEEHEKVVTSANFLIDSESKLRLALERFKEKEGAPLKPQEGVPTPTPPEEGKGGGVGGGHAGHGM